MKGPLGAVFNIPGEKGQNTFHIFACLGKSYPTSLVWLGVARSGRPVRIRTLSFQPWAVQAAMERRGDPSLCLPERELEDTRVLLPS